MNIHLVEPLNNFVKVQDNVWESGSWGLEESQAKKLVGGEIYFHKKRQEADEGEEINDVAKTAL